MKLKKITKLNIKKLTLKDEINFFKKYLLK